MTDQSKKTGWEHFPHKADMGVRGFGDSKEKAFEQTALALIAIITDPATVEPQWQVQIECHAPDDELLLVDWLNHLVYEMDQRKWLFSRFEVKITDNELSATVWGQPVDVEKHQPAVEVKAATYTSLSVTSDKEGNWTAQCIVDV